MHARESFETVADLYAEVRQGYPAALYDDLAAEGLLGPRIRVLEAGCGAGQATRDLAARAGGVLALDPGPSLIAAARERVADPKVTFQTARFEDAAITPGAFDLVASAQAWHWIEPAAACAKAGTALAEGGGLAIFGHVSRPPPEAFLRGFEAVFRRHAPELWGQPGAGASYRPPSPHLDQIAHSGLFGDVRHRRYDWTWRLNSRGLGQYLRTVSSYRVLPDARRFALFDALSDLVAAQGDVIDTRWETHLYLALRNRASIG
jgi:SAM-dependent methyltransferase